MKPGIYRVSQIALRVSQEGEMELRAQVGTREIIIPCELIPTEDEHLEAVFQECARMAVSWLHLKTGDSTITEAYREQLTPDQLLPLGILDKESGHWWPDHDKIYDHFCEWREQHAPK